MLRTRWLGRVPYAEADALQRALWAGTRDDYVLLFETPHVYTLGRRADPAHLLVEAATAGASVVHADRGGDVTYHGPGQLVGYPILTLVDTPHGLPDTPGYVHAVEQVVIDALGDLGVIAGRMPAYPGVWIDPGGSRPRKICAIGVRLSRGRSMHGFALNVDPDLAMFDHIVPCGISEYGVTSLAAEGVTVTMRAVVDVIERRAAQRWGRDAAPERQHVAWRRDQAAHGHRDPLGLSGAAAQVAADLAADVSSRSVGRLAGAGVDSATAVAITDRKPDWVRVTARLGDDYRNLKRTMRSLDLVTVCEEAGCPNIFECWADGTATFMINGERCTRACGFCLVDTRHPVAPDPGEPERVASAVDRMGLDHAVVTAVARDDLADGGASGFAQTVHAIRRHCPAATVEVLIPDCKGDEESLATIFASRPDVLNHNIETVARLQRAVRPSAGYARSLAVLARASDAGLATKSGLILGMGERDDEVAATLADLRAVGVRIVTMGQYLRPTARHIPVQRWVPLDTFASLAAVAYGLGFTHVESSPMTRSSYHAKRAVASPGLSLQSG